MIKGLLIMLDETLHWRFKQKCRFNHLTMQEVTATLIEEFEKGTFDSLFPIK